MTIQEYSEKHSIPQIRIERWLSGMQFHPDYPLDAAIRAISEGLDAANCSVNQDVPGFVGGMVLSAAERLCPDSLIGICVQGVVGDSKVLNPEAMRFEVSKDPLARSAGRYRNGVLNLLPI